MEEMSRMKRKKEQLTNIHDDDVEKIFEEEVEPSDDSHFPTREDFHEYKKQRTKRCAIHCLQHWLLSFLLLSSRCSSF